MLSGEKKASTNLSSELSKSNAQSITQEKDLLIRTVEENNSWLQPFLKQIVPSNIKEEKFIAMMHRILSKKVMAEEDISHSILYLTWVNLLNPKIDTISKEKMALECAKRYSEYVEFAQLLCYKPTILTAIFLFYSPAELIASYHKYQNNNYSQNKEPYFAFILKFLTENKHFSQKDKKIFVKNVWDAMKEVEPPINRSKNYIQQELLGSWHKNGLIQSLVDFFDEEIITAIHHFKKELQQVLEKPNSSLSLAQEYGSFVFETLIAENKGNAEILTPVVLQFYDQIDYLIEIYRAHQLDPIKMMTRHLLQLAKLTNNEFSSDCAALFFSNGFEFLNKMNSISFLVPEIAKFLAPVFFVKKEYAFSSMRNDLLLHWMDHNPEKILAVIQTVLTEPNEEFETPIEKFFTYYAKLPENFYRKLFTLLSDKLTPEQLIKLYTVIPDEFQSKMVAERCGKVTSCGRRI